MTEEAEIGARRTILRYLPLLLLLLALAAVLLSGGTRYLSLDALQENDAALRAFVEAHWFEAILLFIVAYAAVTAVSIPGATVMTVAGGYLFGTWVGGLASVVGATAGAVSVFYVVRTSLGETLRRRAESSGGRLKSIIDGVAAGAFGYILTLRLIPLVPFWLLNVAAGVAHAPAGAYALATFIGIMPATFIYAGIGSGIGTLIQRGDTIDMQSLATPELLLPLAGLGLLSLAATIYRQRRNMRSAAP